MSAASRCGFDSTSAQSFKFIRLQQDGCAAQNAGVSTAPDTSTHPLRQDDDALLRGQGCYGQDIPLPGALHGAFVRSAHAHAQFRATHLDEARSLTGVVAVLAGKDLGRHTMPPMNPLLPLLEDQDFPLLAQSTLPCVGQPVALVLAGTAQQAAAAAARVRVEVDERPVTADFVATLPSTHTRHTGGAASTDMKLRVAATHASPRVVAMAMEPRACSAQWDAKDERLTVWLGTQTPSRAQADNQSVATEVAPGSLLVDVLREQLQLTGTHQGCDTAQCGACTVMVDGQAVKSCNRLALQCAGRSFTSIEGLAPGDRALHVMQAMFRHYHGLQCGFCTPGFAMRAVAMVDEPVPAEPDAVRHALAGNPGYEGIVQAIVEGLRALRSASSGRSLPAPEQQKAA